MQSMHKHVWLVVLAMVGAVLIPRSPLYAGQVLPDELTVNVGTVENVGEDVTIVLTKRSVRAENCQIVLWTDDGFKKLDIPVTTYRGHVEDDPLMYVNGNIEPGGFLNANFTENRMIIGRIRNMKIAVPEGKSTRTMSTGNKVVPLASVRRRSLPTPGGYLVPEVPMRKTRWFVRVLKSYTEHSSIEKAVSEVEQRMNDGDFVFARDLGAAWEIDTIIVVDPRSTRDVDMNLLYTDTPDRKKGIKWANFDGVPGRNQGKFDSLRASGIHHEAAILLHEAAHLYGNPWHQLGAGDGLCGGGAFWDVNNVAVMVETMKLFDERGVERDETNAPAVIYSGVLPPRATHDFANTRKDTPVTIDVLENDYSGSGNYPLSLQAVQPESDHGGTVSISDDGKAIYTPAPGFAGLDKFSYTVVDSEGVGNRSGLVKVDVRAEGLAVHFDFEDAEEELAVDTPWDPRPDAERLVYHYRNKGPYNHGSRGTALYIEYTPTNGIRGKGIWNSGTLRQGQVQLGDLGDPGRGSLSASVWVMYPPGGDGHVILGKGGAPFKFVNGWTIAGGGVGKNFEFSGNVVRLLQSEVFSLTSEEAIEPNKWYHLVMVMDRETKRLRAWVNNKEVAPEANVRIPDGVIEYWTPLLVFNRYTGKWWHGTKAVVDEVKIFTSVLTPGQVAELYAEGRNAPVPKLPLVMEIVKAEYGVEGRFQDVTDVVRRSTVRGQPRIQLPSSSYNGAFGDPAQGVLKELRIQYRLDGKAGEAVFAEDAPILLPTPQ